MMKSLVLMACLLSAAWADDRIRGVLIYETYPSAKPLSAAFSEISWQSAALGSISLVDGGEFKFSNNSVVKIIYLDEPYWRQINDDDGLQIYRTDILGLEEVLPMNRSNMVTDRDLETVRAGQKKLTELIAAYPELRYKNILQAALMNLEMQVQRYGEGQRKVNAQWLTAGEYAAIGQSPAPPPPANVLTTVDGKTYENYQVTKVDAASLHIVYPGGVAVVPLAKLSKEIQAKYNYDPAKAEALIQSENNRVVAENRPPEVPTVTEQGEQVKLETFLAQQTPDAADSYRKVFKLLDSQKVNLLVTRSHVTPNGVLILQYDYANLQNPDLANGKPIFIVGRFTPDLDNAPFHIDTYPAGVCGDQDYTDTTLPRFVTNKLDYLRVMQISFEKKFN